MEHEKHMLEVEKSSDKLHFARHFMTQAKLQVTYKTLYFEDFKCDLSSSLPYYIYPHKIVRRLFKEKP